MSIKKKPVGQPEDWWQAWEAEAKQQGLSRDAWIGQCCNANLPKATQKVLSERPTRGRKWPDKSSENTLEN